jgi:7-cyano-7-deazaguanine synthase
VGARASRHRLVLLSGGLDSSAVLFRPHVGTTSALFVDYGQVSAEGERLAAQRVAAAAGVPLEMADAPALAALGAGSLSGANRAVCADGETELQRSEWFPGRNLLLIAIAGISLGRNGGGLLCFGASEGVYEDTRPAFFAMAEKAMGKALPQQVRACISVATGCRIDALRAGVAAGFEPRMSFSCNRRGDRHCWRCASCRDRSTLLEELASTRP